MCRTTTVNRDASIGRRTPKDQRGVLRDDVLGIDILSPADLAATNPNALHGDIFAGANDLDQSYLWRPVASNGRHRTDIPGLWHIGASTHPGGGLGAGSGHLVATTLTTSNNTKLRVSVRRRR